ncbi:MAG TPA: hypothetical protein VFW87_20575 [Pirellulales bacterium]|nr:hypothetical protein [Pirellulales bacterium]
MKKTFTLAAALLMAVGSTACNQAGPGAPNALTQSNTTERTTTTTTPAPTDRAAGGGANVDVERDRTTAPLAGPTDGGVNVDVTPGGGVDVDVQGQPVRDRIRERRAQRNATMPR